MNRIFEIEKEELQKYLDMHMTYMQIAEKYNCSHWTVMQRAKEYGLKSEARKYQMQEDNPSARQEVRNKISQTVAKLWEEGAYANRINGMEGLRGEKNPKYKPEGSSHDYREKTKFYYPEPVCMCCGKKLSWDDKSMEIHHVDYDHNNYLLTNLMPLCHSCHKKYHRKFQPVVTITKSFVFDSCHYLPFHDAKCQFLHGHTYHMDISVRNRVMQETGMVIDFRILKKIVEEEVINKFDHGFINEHIPYPTCELMVGWIWRALSLKLKGIESIKLWETDGSYCEMTKEDALQYLKDYENGWTKDKKEE